MSYSDVVGLADTTNDSLSSWAWEHRSGTLRASSFTPSHTPPHSPSMVSSYPRHAHAGGDRALNLQEEGLLDHSLPLKSERKTHHRTPRSVWDGLFAASMYGLVSVIMVLANKAVLSSFRESYPIALVIVQNSLGFVGLQIGRLMGLFRVPRIPMHHIISLFALSILYSSNTVFALFSLKFSTVPTYSALRRFSTLTNIGLGSVLGMSRTNWNTTMSVLVIVFGNLLVGFGDLEFSFAGYVCGFISTVLQSLVLLYSKQISTQVSLDSLQMVYFQQLFSLPVLLVAFFLSDEIDMMYISTLWKNSTFLSAFVLSAILGFLLQLSILFCTLSTSALTTSVVGQIKSIVQAILSYFLFPFEFGPVYFLGSVISCIGSAVYTREKYLENVKE